MSSPMLKLVQVLLTHRVRFLIITFHNHSTLHTAIMSLFGFQNVLYVFI
jgi:hypothetical protein